MQTLSPSGVVYRTKALSADQAARFAKCLSANPNFGSVEVAPSPRAAGKQIVTYVPANTARQAAMLAREVDKRAAKAAEEGQEYGFALDPDSPQPFAWCFNPTSGETYEVTLFDCSCPDYRFRLKGTAVRCKHMVTLSQVVAALPEFETVGKRAEGGGDAAEPAPLTPAEQEWCRRRAEWEDNPLDWEENW